MKRLVASREPTRLRIVDLKKENMVKQCSMAWSRENHSLVSLNVAEISFAGKVAIQKASISSSRQGRAGKLYITEVERALGLSINAVASKWHDQIPAPP